MIVTKKPSYRSWIILAVLLLIVVLFLTAIYNRINHAAGDKREYPVPSERSLESAIQEIGSPSAPSSIQQVMDEAYTSEYDLRVIGFFYSKVWEAMDADARAFILGHTIKNESHYYGISPAFYVDVADLGWSLKYEDLKMDDIILLQCDSSAFSWQPDTLFPSIIIDKKLLENLDPSEALFVCHKALYYAYARYLLALEDEQELPDRYFNCKEQLAQYRKDLHAQDGTYTTLENDAISYALSRVEHYYGFIAPNDAYSFYESQLRRYWRFCLNGIYKKDLLHQLADEMTEDSGITYRIANSEATKEEYRRQSNQEYVFIAIDDELLWNGDPLDCVNVLVQAMIPTAAEKHAMAYNEGFDPQQRRISTCQLAWERLMEILLEHEPNRQLRR